MKQKLLKALVVLDSRENSWVLSGVPHKSIERHLIEVKGLRVNMGDSNETVLAILEHAPDVLLLDSTLARNFALSIIIQVRERIPALPIVDLPDIYAVLEPVGDLPEAAGNPASLSLAHDDARDSAMKATDTIARTIRYTHGHFDLQRALLHMALRDDLTGLHNRRGFMALATRYLKWARDAGQKLVMFFADVDGLKSINDRFGHGEGDRAIVRAAACMRETFRQSDVVARLSGDEFVALVIEGPGRNAEAICRRLQSELAQRARADSRYSLSLSVGVAYFDPGEPVALHDLLRRADIALYRKKRGKRSEFNAIAATPVVAHEPLVQSTIPMRERHEHRAS